MTPTTVRLHVGTDGGFDAVALDPGIGMTVLPGDAAEGDPGVQVAAGLSQLREELARHLVGYLTPVVAAIHPHASKRASALWGAVARAQGARSRTVQHLPSSRLGGAEAAHLAWLAW